MSEAATDDETDSNEADNDEAPSESIGFAASDAITSTKQRHPYTNDVLALWLVVTYPTLIGLDAWGLIDMRIVPRPLILGYVGLVGTAVAWAFGSAAVDAWASRKA